MREDLFLSSHRLESEPPAGALRSSGVRVPAEPRPSHSRGSFTFEAEGPHMGPVIMGAGVTVPVVSEKRQTNSRLESGQIVPHRGDRVANRVSLAPFGPPACDLQSNWATQGSGYKGRSSLAQAFSAQAPGPSLETHIGPAAHGLLAAPPGAQSRRRRATAPQLSYLGTPGRPLAVEFKLRRRARTLAQAQRTAEAPIQMRRRPRPRKCLWDVLRGFFGTIDFGGAEPGPVTWHFSACR
jgi:hypothetical protein